MCRKDKGTELSVSGEDATRRYGDGPQVHRLLRLDNADQLFFSPRMESVAQKH